MVNGGRNFDRGRYLILRNQKVSDRIFPNELLEQEEMLDDKNSILPIVLGKADLFARETLEESTLHADESTKGVIGITMTGNVLREEIVKTCRRDPVRSTTRSVIELKGFKKTRLNPGESNTESLPILPECVSFTNIDMRLIVAAGDFHRTVEHSPRGEDLLKMNLQVL